MSNLELSVNLGSNAEYAMRETGGVLEVRLDTIDVSHDFARLHPPLDPGPHVRLTVQDTGHGMTPETMERIFEPFFTTKDVEDGTGIGLAVVHGIVTNHHGAITVSSRVGEGTQFTIYLPQVEATAEEAGERDTPLLPGHGRILFIDDEDMLVRGFKALMELIGYEVVATTSGAEALAFFRSSPQDFDVVVTDQTMPEMTGEQLAIELRQIRSDIPIILCTGYSHVMELEKAREMRLDAFLMKPVNAQHLIQTIEQVLTQRPQSEPQA